MPRRVRAPARVRAATASLRARLQAVSGGLLLPFVRAGRNFHRDAATFRAAAMAYYALLSFFPFILLLASVGSLFLGDSTEEARRVLAPLRPFLPFLGSVFWEKLQELVDNRGVLSAFSLAALVFLASQMMVATERAIGFIFHARRTADVLRRRRWFDRLRAYVLTLAALLSLGLLFVTITVVE